MTVFRDFVVGVGYWPLDVLRRNLQQQGPTRIFRWYAGGGRGDPLNSVSTTRNPVKQQDLITIIVFAHLSIIAFVSSGNHCSFELFFSCLQSLFKPRQECLCMILRKKAFASIVRHTSARRMWEQL